MDTPTGLYREKTILLSELDNLSEEDQSEVKSLIRSARGSYESDINLKCLILYDCMNYVLGISLYYIVNSPREREMILNLEAIAVSNFCRRKGIATSILKRLKMELAKQNKRLQYNCSLYMEVHTTNAITINYCLKFGFRPYGWEPQHFKRLNDFRLKFDCYPFNFFIEGDDPKGWTYEDACEYPQESYILMTLDIN